MTRAPETHSSKIPSTVTELFEASWSLLAAAYDNGIFNDAMPAHVQTSIARLRSALEGHCVANDKSALERLA